MNTEQSNVNNIPELANQPAPLGTLQTISSTALVNSASEMAKDLAKIIDRQRLFTVIQGKKFVNVEGWTTLATMLGCVAREIETIETDGVYIATVELVRLSDGFRIGKASAECGEESPWSKRAKYARRSMAQTRATSKACRLAFSWIMQLAGYEVTPAEEMTPIIDAIPLKISSTQLNNLKNLIVNSGLEIERVEKWVKTAWNIREMSLLTPEMLEQLLPRIGKWAAQEYEKAEKVTALNPEFEEQPIKCYADIRG